MPIYEYECEACGYRHEVIQKISDELLRDCPSCAKSALKKLVSAAGFRLSGSGWYETDFKKTGRRNLTDNDSKDASKSKAPKSSDSAKSSSIKKPTSNSSSARSGSS